MAKTPEAKVKDAVKKRLIEYGVLPFMQAADIPDGANGMFWFPIQGQFAVAGVHDVVGCWLGRFFSLEIKAPNNPKDATEPQLAFQRAVSGACGISLVGVRDASAVDELCRLITE